MSAQDSRQPREASERQPREASERQPREASERQPRPAHFSLPAGGRACPVQREIQHSYRGGWAPDSSGTSGRELRLPGPQALAAGREAQALAAGREAQALAAGREAQGKTIIALDCVASWLLERRMQYARLAPLDRAAELWPPNLSGEATFGDIWDRISREALGDLLKVLAVLPPEVKLPAFNFPGAPWTLTPEEAAFRPGLTTPADRLRAETAVAQRLLKYELALAAAGEGPAVGAPNSKF